jgi:hypothetical protein
MPPADGIQEFDFVATPPTGIHLPYLEPITGHGSLSDMPTWVKGVRIFAKTNDIEKSFPRLANDTSIEPAVNSASEDETVDEIATSKPGILAESMLVEGDASAPEPTIEGTSCRSFLLASVSVPEVKTEMVVKCVLKDPFSGKCIAKTKVPVLYRRTSKVRLFAKVCVPDDQKIWDEVSECIKEAVIAGVVAGVLTQGNLAAAAAVLKAFLIACLKRKVGDLSGDISVKLDREKTVGVWKPV